MSRGKGDRVRMAPFLGNHHNKLDAKGRVSIPAQFRNALRAESRDGANSVGVPLILRPSHNRRCIEGWPEKGFEALAKPLEQYADFSEEHDDFATAIYAEACPLETDKEGRIVLPAELAAYAGLTDGVVFLGMGKRFEIWEPAAAARRREEARQRAAEKQLTLRTAAE